MFRGALILMGILYTVGVCGLFATTLGLMTLQPDPVISDDTVSGDSEGSANL